MQEKRSVWRVALQRWPGPANCKRNENTYPIQLGGPIHAGDCGRFLSRCAQSGAAACGGARTPGGLAAPPLLVIAGDGSGKINTLAHRVAHLIVEGADPNAILLMFLPKSINDRNSLDFDQPFRRCQR